MSDYEAARKRVGAFADYLEKQRGAIKEADGPHRLTMPDGSVTIGPVADLVHALLSIGEDILPDLRLLLSGPPEPSVEEVAETIGYYFGTLVSRNPQPDMSGDPRAKLQPHIRRRFDSAAREAAQAVQALYRSAGASNTEGKT